MKCACTLGSRAPLTCSESAELSCACPSFRREKFTEPTRYGYFTRFFLQRGCCCHGKEDVPVHHIRGKGLSSRLTSGSKIRLTAGFESKIRLTAGFEPCPQGPAPSSFSCSTLSLICTLFRASYTGVRCITFFLGLAASHSSKDPPSGLAALHSSKDPPSSITLFEASSITLFEGPSFLGLLTICISPIEQCALVL